MESFRSRQEHTPSDAKQQQQITEVRQRVTFLSEKRFNLQRVSLTVLQCTRHRITTEGSQNPDEKYQHQY